MPKNAKIIDYKPSNEGIIDYKPQNEAVLDYKPRNENIAPDTTDQLYEVTLGAGMLIGLGPHITYSSDIDIITPKSK